jgi:hypothetical protein
MRRSTVYKIIGVSLFAYFCLGIMLLLAGEKTTYAPGILLAFIGFLFYRQGMRLAFERGESPQHSVHFAVIVAWLRRLVRRITGDKH